MSKIKLYILIIVSSLIGFFLLFFKIFGVIQPAGYAIKNPMQPESKQLTSSDVVDGTIKLSVDYGNGETLEFESPHETDSTAFSVLQEALEQNDVDMETQNYDFGVFVKSINGLQSTQDMSWIYFVNGESGNIAADSYQLNPGDKVEWKYIAPSEN